MKDKQTTLIRVLKKVPSNQTVIVKDYLRNFVYVTDTVETIIDKVLDYDQLLRNSSVYGIGVEDNALIVHILI